MFALVVFDLVVFLVAVVLDRRRRSPGAPTSVNTFDTSLPAEGIPIDARLLPTATGPGALRPADQVIKVNTTAAIPPVVPAPAYTIERREPLGPMTQQAAGATATLVVVVVVVCVFGLALVTLALGWSWRVWAGLAGVAIIGLTVWRLRVADAVLWRVETFTGLDLDRNGAIGQPAQSFALVNPYEARQAAAQVVTEKAESAKRQELIDFTRRCYLVGCSEGAHGVKASGPDRETYTARRDALFALGVAGWRNPDRPKAGWRVLVSEAEAVALIGQHVL